MAGLVVRGAGPPLRYVAPDVRGAGGDPDAGQSKIAVTASQASPAASPTESTASLA